MIHIFDTITSTNSWLSTYSKQLGDMAIAKEQTKGKGRLGNSWESPIGGFYFSVLSRSHKLLPLIMGLSVILSLKEFVSGVKLKWPNDIIFSNKKMGGILCENLGNISVSGVGLNLNNNTSYSDSISLYRRPTRFPTSLFLSFFLGYFDSLFESSSKYIADKFASFDILIDQIVYWDGNKGKAESINEDGSLLVRSSNELLNLYSGEVHLERK